MTAEKCKDIVIAKKNDGTCDTNYFYWDENARVQDDCNCCLGPEEDIKFVYDKSYNTYIIDLE
jgi:hypothetical protein